MVDRMVDELFILSGPLGEFIVISCELHMEFAYAMWESETGDGLAYAVCLMRKKVG